MAVPAAAISCPRRPWSPSRLWWRHSASTARFLGEPDPETNFKLFGPVACATSAAETTSRAFALRLRPNQDFAGALEAFCRDRGIIHAKLHGGVGSTIGVRFADGRIVEPFATELAIRSGVIAAGAGGTLEAELDIAVVDYTGGLAEGRLKRGDNPVLMTMELVLEVVAEGGDASLATLGKCHPPTVIPRVGGGSRNAFPVLLLPSLEYWIARRAGR